MLARLNIVKKTINEFFKFSRYYGIVYASYNLIWWMNFYIVTPWRFKISRWALIHKTQFLSKFIENNFKDIIEHYCKNSIFHSETISNPNIWVFWGQGESEMPVLVKSCFRQLCRHYDNVVLITADNYNEYVSMPVEILTKCKRGELSWAHFSDILRNAILYQRGGLWLDATVWTTETIPFDKLNTMAFFSANGKIPVNNKSICFWTTLGYNWSTWCLWSNSKGIPLFGFVSEIMYKVVLNDMLWPDYVFQDFLYFYAIKHLPSIEEYFEKNNSVSCFYRNRLATLMNQPYDENLYKMISSDDFVFKLSFRAKWVPLSKFGTQTFYGKLISE